MTEKSLTASEDDAAPTLGDYIAYLTDTLALPPIDATSEDFGWLCQRRC